MFAALICAALIFLAYGNSLHAPFVLDDIQSVVANPTIRHLADLRTVLTPDSGTTAGRPLVNLSFAFNHGMQGDAVFGYHVLNVVIHVAAAWLLFALIRRTLLLPRFSDRYRHAAGPIALGAALIWALHPLQTETVTYISERSEGLMAVCYLFVLNALARSATSVRPRAWLAGSVVAAYAGMACKEVMVTAPVVALLFDRACLSHSWREVGRQRWGYHAAMMSSWVLLATLMTVFPIRDRGVGFAVGLSWTTYTFTELKALFIYLRLTLWPAPLVFDYGPHCTVTGFAEAVPYAIVILCAAALAIFAWRRNPPLGFLAGSFFVLLAPTSSVVPIALQPIAESRMYLPLAVLAVLGSLGLHLTASRLGRTAAGYLVAGLAALALMVGTVARNRDYASAVRLWTDTVEKAPDNPRAYNSLGTALAAAGRTDDAHRAFEAAVAVDPQYAPAQFNLGATLLDAHRPADALVHLEAARAIPNEQAKLQFYLGQALVEMGRNAEAIPPLREAVRLAPNDVEPAFALGNALAVTGRYDDAAAAFQAAAQRAPNQPRIVNNLANALAYAGHLDAAIATYQQAVALSPGDASIRENLAQAIRVRDAQAARR